mgnify:CR=1 FL=1
MRFLEDMILKLGSVDRRFIFILIGLAVLIPLMRPIDLPIRTTPTTEKVYNAIAEIPANSKVLMSFDYGPSTKPEIHPMTLGVMRQVLRNGHQIYITCLWPDGLYMALDALEEIKKHTSLVINSLGSGSSGDVIFLFFEDICGETGDPPGKMPKHAKSWGDGKAIREKLDQERRNAIKGFKEDVVAGNFPSEDYTVSMLPGEKDKLIEELDKI